MATLQRLKTVFLFVYILAVLFVSAFAKAEVQINSFRTEEQTSLLLVEGTLSGCETNPKVLVEERSSQNGRAHLMLSISTETSVFCDNSVRKFSVVADPTALTDLRNVEATVVFRDSRQAIVNTVSIPNERTAFEANTHQMGIVVFLPAQMVGSSSKYVLITSNRIFELNSFFDLSSYVGAPVEVEGYDLTYSIVSSSHNGDGFLKSSDGNKKLSSMFLSQISFVPLHKTQN